MFLSFSKKNSVGYTLICPFVIDYHIFISSSLVVYR